MMRVKEIKGVLWWVSAVLKDSKVWITVSPPTINDDSSVLICQFPLHKNLKLLNFDEEIERADLFLQPDWDSCDEEETKRKALYKLKRQLSIKTCLQRWNNS